MRITRLPVHWRRTDLTDAEVVEIGSRRKGHAWLPPEALSCPILTSALSPSCRDHVVHMARETGRVAEKVPNV